MTSNLAIKIPKKICHVRKTQIFIVLTTRQVTHFAKKNASCTVVKPNFELEPASSKESMIDTNSCSIDYTVHSR